MLSIKRKGAEGSSDIQLRADLNETIVSTEAQRDTSGIVERLFYTSSHGRVFCTTFHVEGTGADRRFEPKTQRIV